jgi:hypothetical protein
MGKERRGGPWPVDGLAEFLIREPHAQCSQPIQRCVISFLDRPPSRRLHRYRSTYTAAVD